MNFIFDEFIQIEANGSKPWISVTEIAIITPNTIDTCDIVLRSGIPITGVKLPAPVLLNKINRIREQKRKEFARN